MVVTANPHPATAQPHINPLMDKIRIPGETFTLPSLGVFYNNGEIRDDAEGGAEVTVYPMTVIDEIVLKTPDLLYSGRAVHEVFSRCIPQILKPSEILAKDVDFLMLCLRKVSFGDEIDLTASHQGCSAAASDGKPKINNYRAHVSRFISETKKLDPSTIEKTFTVELENDQVVHMCPMRYGDYVVLMQVQEHDSELAPEQQVAAFAKSISSVIVSVDGVDDKDDIAEWIAKLPPKYVAALTKAMEAGAGWGPEYVHRDRCRDCGEKLEVGVPMNPLVFFS